MGCSSGWLNWFRRTRSASEGRPSLERMAALTKGRSETYSPKALVFSIKPNVPRLRFGLVCDATTVLLSRLRIEAPAGAVFAVFQRDVQRCEAVADAVGRGEVFVAACVGADVDQQFHQLTG